MKNERKKIVEGILIINSSIEKWWKQYVTLLNRWKSSISPPSSGWLRFINSLRNSKAVRVADEADDSSAVTAAEEDVASWLLFRLLFSCCCRLLDVVVPLLVVDVVSLIKTLCTSYYPTILAYLLSNIF